MTILICERCGNLDDPPRQACPCTAWRLAHPPRAAKPKPRPAPALSRRRPTITRGPDELPVLSHAQRREAAARARFAALDVPILDVIAAAAAEHHHTTTTPKAGAA